MVQVQSIANDIRDLMNWITVFETEYDLPREVVDQLKSRLEKIAEDVRELT